MKRIPFIQEGLLLFAILFFTQKAQAQLPVDFSKINPTETLKSCQATLQNFVSARKAMVLMEQNFTRKGLAQAFIPIPGGQVGYTDIYLYYFVMGDKKQVPLWMDLFTQNGESNQRASSFRVSNTIPVQDGYIFQLQIEPYTSIRNRKFTSNELQMIASKPGNLLVFSLNKP
ncbi:hypothetical protein LC612_43050 [Nostoc sp. CHAB 5834]|nr:hypothetical protein [Nostoc sp. CHAB 5834]